MPDLPEIVCLCGSTRFRDEYREQNARLTLEGNIVLSVGFFHHSGDAPPGVSAVVEEFEQSETKADLDELHKRKIDLADSVFVVNPGGYIGDSTRSEIDYAHELGVPIEFLEAIATMKQGRSNGLLHVDRGCHVIDEKDDDELVIRPWTVFDPDQDFCGYCAGGESA